MLTVSSNRQNHIRTENTENTWHLHYHFSTHTHIHFHQFGYNLLFDDQTMPTERKAYNILPNTQEMQTKLELLFGEPKMIKSLSFSVCVCFSSLFKMISFRCKEFFTFLYFCAFNMRSQSNTDIERCFLVNSFLPIRLFHFFFLRSLLKHHNARTGG